MIDEVASTIKAADRAIRNPLSTREQIAEAIAKVDALGFPEASAALRSQMHEQFANSKAQSRTPPAPAPEEEADAYRALDSENAKERLLATSMPGFGPRHLSRAVANRVINDLPAPRLVQHLHDEQAWVDVLRHADLPMVLSILNHPRALQFNVKQLHTEAGRDAFLKRLAIESPQNGQHLIDALLPAMPMDFIPTLYTELAKESAPDEAADENPLLLFVDSADPDTQRMMPDGVWRQFWESLVLPNEAWERVPLTAPLTDDDAREWMEAALAHRDTDGLRRLAQMRNLSPSLSQEVADHLSTMRKSETARDFLLPMPPGIYAYWRAAHTLIGAKARDDNESLLTLRRLAWLHDADPAATALAAIDWPNTRENREILQAAVGMMPLTKKETDVGGVPVTSRSKIEAMRPSGVDVAKALTDNLFSARPAKLDGRHSAGSFFIDTPEGIWYMKPGSGRAGPIKGIQDDPSPPSAREAAFWRLSQLWGMSSDYVRTEWMRVDDKLYAAISFLPSQYKPMIEARINDPGRVLSAVEAYRLRGRLWQWSVLDWVAGNGDCHGHNMLMNPQGEIRLIDHGSAFAGMHFDPAHDQESFTPYYLRFMTPEGETFNTLPPKEKIRLMPDLPTHVAGKMKAWAQSLSEDDMASALREFDIDPRPEINRLRQIQGFTGDLAAAVNGLWAGA